jgi:hypothetical protein
MKESMDEFFDDKKQPDKSPKIKVRGISEKNKSEKSEGSIYDDGYISSPSQSGMLSSQPLQGTFQAKSSSRGTKHIYM